MRFDVYLNIQVQRQAELQLKVDAIRNAIKNLHLQHQQQQHRQSTWSRRLHEAAEDIEPIDVEGDEDN